MYVARFSPDGTVVVTGGRQDGGIRLWTGANDGGNRLGTGKQQGGVTDAVFARDGRTVPGECGARQDVSEWSVPSAKRIPNPHIPRRSFARRVLFRRVAPRRGRQRTGPFAKSVGNGKGEAPGLLPQGLELACAQRRRLQPGRREGSCSRPGLATCKRKTWDVRTGARRHELVGHSGPASRGAFRPDGKWIATTGPITVGLWQRGRRPAVLLSPASGHGSQGRKLPHERVVQP